MSSFFRKHSPSTGSRSSLARPKSVASQATQEDEPVPQPEALGADAAAGQNVSTTLKRQSMSVIEKRTNFSQQSSQKERSSQRDIMATHRRERSTSESLVRAGYLMKKGVINLAWKKRWFVLTNRSLLYFDTQPGTENGANDTPKGEISLVMITKVDVKGDDNRQRFNIYTPTRVFKLKTESIPESEAWIAAISGAAEMEKKQNRATRPRRPSLSLVDSLKLEGETVFNTETRIHTPADINKWESWRAFDVASWLGTFNMHWYALNFFNAGINGPRLAKLTTTTDLERIGIKNKQHQLVILKQIGMLVKGELQT